MSKKNYSVSVGTVKNYHKDMWGNFHWIEEGELGNSVACQIPATLDKVIRYYEKSPLVEYISATQCRQLITVVMNKKEGSK